MNKWSESLGCEVNECRAAICNAEFMRICALRKAWQQRVAQLKLRLSKQINPANKLITCSKLRELGVDVQMTTCGQAVEVNNGRAIRNIKIKHQIQKLKDTGITAKEAFAIVAPQYFLTPRQIKRIWEETRG